MVKLAALAIALTLLPLAFLIWYWQQLHLAIKALIIVYLVVMLICLYPITSFAFSMTRIEQVFPDDCDSALRLSKQGVVKRYPDIYVTLLRSLFGFTPNYYYSSTIGICEYKRRNYDGAIAAFERALADSEQVDLKNKRKVEEALRKAKSLRQENSPRQQQ